ncbi:uncharacterized protein LOC136084165 [Hydra vulgaris]|uniref:Uncharacterized protein LOC136084165 n=1 Tax=Hydra vulgaris TaxID=6087 RepID=A0ABM4CF82_HYDVU
MHQHRHSLDQVELVALPTQKDRKQATKPEWEVTDINQIKTVVEIPKWVIEDSRPFSTVETDAFTRIMKTTTNGQFGAITAKNISTRYIPLLFKFIKEQVKNIFNTDKSNLNVVAFTSDVWTTDHTNLSFMSRTLHYIDSMFQLKRFLVEMSYFPKQHTGDNIAKKLNESLNKLELDFGIKTWITVDGAANVQADIRKLIGVQSAIWCVDHRLNLVVSGAVDDKRCPKRSILNHKITKLVGHFNESSQKAMTLVNAAKALNNSRTKLVQRFPTR